MNNNNQIFYDKRPEQSIEDYVCELKEKGIIPKDKQIIHVCSSKPPQRMSNSDDNIEHVSFDEFQKMFTDDLQEMYESIDFSDTDISKLDKFKCQMGSPLNPIDSKLYIYKMYGLNLDVPMHMGQKLKYYFNLFCLLHLMNNKNSFSKEEVGILMTFYHEIVFLIGTITPDPWCAVICSPLEPCAKYRDLVNRFYSNKSFLQAFYECWNINSELPASEIDRFHKNICAELETYIGKENSEKLNIIMKELHDA
jgi:hypothetical protein